MSTPLSESSTGPLRAAVVAVQLPDADDDAFAASVAELKRLGHTLGVALATCWRQISGNSREFARVSRKF